MTPAEERYAGRVKGNRIFYESRLQVRYLDIRKKAVPVEITGIAGFSFPDRVTIETNLLVFISFPYLSDERLANPLHGLPRPTHLYRHRSRKLPVETGLRI